MTDKSNLTPADDAKIRNITIGDFLEANRLFRATRKLRLGVALGTGAYGGAITYAGLSAAWFTPLSTVIAGTALASALYAGTGYAVSTGALEATAAGFASKEKSGTFKKRVLEMVKRRPADPAKS